MKKILAIILCAVILCAMPIVASAEESLTDVTDQTETVTETLPEDEVETTPTEILVDYVKSHVEELSVICTLLLTIFYEVRKHGKLNGSIGILNNNAIAVAEKSEDAIKTALTKVECMAEQVEGYKKSFDAILEEIRKSDDEKKALQDALLKVENYLKTAKLANIEFASELANLIGLSNIPNTKKEEFFSAHRAAVDAIIEVERTEVNIDDGQTT